MSKTRGVLAGAVAALAMMGAAALTPAAAQDKLSYFTWDGYELPDFNKSYVAAHPDALDVSKFGDDDEAFTKVKAGFKPTSPIPATTRSCAGKTPG